MILALLHNIFGASGGDLHPSVAAAAIYAMSRGRAVELAGGTDAEIADAYKYGFGDAFGWTHEETDWFWNNERMETYDQDAVDAYDSYVDWKRATAPERAAAIMRGG